MTTISYISELLKSGNLGTVKDSVSKLLWADAVTIKFTKVDGTEREMNVTLRPELMEQVVAPILAENAEIKVSRPRRDNPDVRTVYDLDSKSWKSFRWDSLISVTYNGDTNE